jgi:hypothetical protein
MLYFKFKRHLINNYDDKLNIESLPDHARHFRHLVVLVDSEALVLGPEEHHVHVHELVVVVVDYTGLLVDTIEHLLD